MAVEVQNNVVMKELLLFSDKNGRALSNLDLLNALKDLKADQTDVLYIHSSLLMAFLTLKKPSFAVLSTPMTNIAVLCSSA